MAREATQSLMIDSREAELLFRLIDETLIERLLTDVDTNNRYQIVSDILAIGDRNRTPAKYLSEAEEYQRSRYICNQRDGRSEVL